MKRLLFILMAIAFCASCTSLTEMEPESTSAPSVPMKFSATLEPQDSTKTILGGNYEDKTRKVLWEPDDAIIVMPAQSSINAVFKNTASENASKVEFSGVIPYSESYWALYPCAYFNSATASFVCLTLPSVQHYKEGSFDTDTAPMVARSTESDELVFKNLCGLLAVRMTGDKAVKSITFAGFDSNGKAMDIAGKFYVSMDYKTNPELVPMAPEKSVTLECDEAVMLSPSDPASFYIVLPPATYSSFLLSIITEDGKVMFKEGNKPLQISRSDLKPTASFVFAEEVEVDLTEAGFANSYIVSERGLYSFNASVAGNGEFGIIDGMPMFADSPYINPVSAELLWEDHSGMIGGVSCSDGRIRFTSNGIEGNALIAAKDADGKILWSWHIWCTDKPVDHLYKNSYGEFTMMDRNLGATRADHGNGDEWHESCGLSYQWGRKDPFVGGLFTSSSESSDIAFSIENPTIKMSNWNSGSGYWSPTSNTIYDPCPVGYMVCPMDAFRGFSIENVSGSFENGWNFIYDGINSAWYPCKAYAEESGISYWGDSYMWSSSNSNDLFYSSSSSVYSYRHGSAPDLNPLRCMRQGDIQPVVFQVDPVSSITSSSAELTCEIAVNGSIPATEAGFVYSTSPSPELDSATKIECTLQDHKIEATISGLSAYTKYYVRAYAIYQGETYYSEERSFYTPNESGIVDLSLGGTSNSYIVPPTSCTYSIPLLKGNSSETVGAAASADIIWETLNTSDAVTAGVLIESVEIKDGKLMFKVSDDKVPGNALIAVKDASDAILWSWHIWVVDYEPLSSAQLYKSGALMMDRNLGALNTSRNDSRAFGLMYQWGRKDPFVGPGEYNTSTFAATSPENAITSVSSSGLSNSINYATEYPNVFIKNSSWNGDDSLWSDVKTIYDPCPSGWRVPDVDVWNGFSSGASEDNGYKFSDSVPAAFYLLTGNISHEFNLVSVGYDISVWTNDRGRYFFSSIGYSNRAQGLNVRCMKDAEFTVSMDIESSRIGGTSAIFVGDVSIFDDTQMESAGFIMSLSDGSPSIYTEDVQVFESQNKSGNIEVKATGLLPGTQYYVRAYAKGGHNVRYSSVHTIKTNAEGDNEDVGSEDFEW